MSVLALPINRFHSSLLLVVLLALSSLPMAGQSFSTSPKTPAEMTELARRYANGIGCPRDAGQAMLWYRQAAREGEPGAMVAIGDMLEEGRCVDQDFVAAVMWYRHAAQLGFAPGMVRLAQMLEQGRGVHFDGDEAHDWYRKAADLGYGPAMTRLGEIEGKTDWY